MENTSFNSLEKKVRFDGMETKTDADQYIKHCKGRAVNLHIYIIGNYSGCDDCEYQNECLNSAFVAGEQAEL